MIKFDKRRDNFDKSATDRLRQLGAGAHPDVAAGAAVTREETRISNLLPVVHLAETLFSAPAARRHRHEGTDALVQAGLPASEGVEFRLDLASEIRSLFPAYPPARGPGDREAHHQAAKEHLGDRETAQRVHGFFDRADRSARARRAGCQLRERSE